VPEGMGSREATPRPQCRAERGVIVRDEEIILSALARGPPCCAELDSALRGFREDGSRALSPMTFSLRRARLRSLEGERGDFAGVFVPASIEVVPQ
jgi:hypothetical protein